MNSPSHLHGHLIRISLDEAGPEELLSRIPLGAPATEGGIAEEQLQDLLFRNPGALPIFSIDASYADTVPICRELSTPAGFVDSLFVNSLGRITLAEFKLWRNPQARGEVIGQILDYTREIASWSYEDLQREVSKTLKTKGNVLFDLVRAKAPQTDEAEFVDRVTRHLRRGEFLLLIIGDGIRESAENIVSFVQKYSGLHFNLALVEAALYGDKDNTVIVQPRVLARTEIVQRIVLEEGLTPQLIDENEGEMDDVLSDLEQENLRFWTAVLQDLAFSDTTIEVPNATKEGALYVKVRNSGYGDWGLNFVGYLYRKSRGIGCYLSCRSGVAAAERTFEVIEGSMEDLREELGEDLECWNNQAGRPRLGFKSQTRFPFSVGERSSQAFEESVAWMRDHLDLLVSTLHPKLQQMISPDG